MENKIKNFDERATTKLFYKDRNLFYWHLARYEFCKQFISKDDIVLDIACGTGYGSYLIGSLAKKVIGLDIDEKVIAENKIKYPLKNIEFICGDATKVSRYINEQIDVVVSFETIEHLDKKEQNIFLTELSKLMKESSILIMSTPNRTQYSKNNITSENPFHKHEMDFEEFNRFLNERFNVVYIYGQKRFDGFQLKKIAMRLASIVNRFKNQKENYQEDSILQLTDFEFTTVDYKNSLYLVAISKNFKQK